MFFSKGPEISIFVHLPKCFLLLTLPSTHTALNFDTCLMKQHKYTKEIDKGNSVLVFVDFSSMTYEIEAETNKI
jgi:hypothetical protein